MKEVKRQSPMPFGDRTEPHFGTVWMIGHGEGMSPMPFGDRTEPHFIVFRGCWWLSGGLQCLSAIGLNLTVPGRRRASA